MDRNYYLSLAESGLRMPVGTDLVLREHADAEKILLDGRQLGNVFLATAERYRAPLAFPVMDLMLEKAALISALGFSGAAADAFHFEGCPTDAQMQRLEENPPLTPRMLAFCDALRHVAAAGRQIPVGMAIGPVSLMTKMLSDPITPIYSAGMGCTAADDEEVLMVERTLELALSLILRYLKAQIEAGAKAIFIAEPTANKAFFSPMQMESGSDVFERYVMRSNLRIKALLDSHGVDLLFHCCGELTDPMLQAFTRLDPAMLSLGSSRVLWQDARIVPKNILLYGNLPTKKFYSDSVLSVPQVEAITRELVQEMKRSAHPFVLGSECDILSVPGCQHIIQRKITAMLEC